MSTTIDVDLLPTIPSSWTAPTSCFASTLYYRVLLGGGYFSNLYGTPTPVLDGNAPAGDCFPPSFTINIPYRTDGDCPTGYTRACATAGPLRSGKPISTVTCCPSVTSNAFSFMCRDHEYGCHGTGTVGAVWTGVITDIGISQPTEEPVTRTPFTNEGIEAWGIKFISVAPTTAAGSARTTDLSFPTTIETITNGASPTTTTGGGNDASPAGLSSGATAGVAIGAAVAVGLLSLAAFLVYRRQKRRVNDNSYSPTNSNDNGPLSNGANEKYVYSTYPDGVNDDRLHEAPPRPDQSQAWELQG